MWVLAGGLAVNVRLGRTHRATNDIDTVSDDQPRLIELLAAGHAERLSAAKVQLQHPEVEIDVMESTDGVDLPAHPSDRAFALARRWTMATASAVELSAVDGQRTVAKVSLRVASLPALPALVALKTVSLPRRRSGNYPHKVGSDMQDLYRLVEGRYFDEALEGLLGAPDELRRWVGGELSATFNGSNRRYSAARLRRFADNMESRSISEDDLSALGDLGDALLGSRP